MKSKIFAIFFLVLVMTCFSTQFVQADLLNEVLSSGGSFINKGKTDGTAANSFGQKLKTEIFGNSGLGLTNMVKLIGNLIIFIVTIILGVKYIFSGIEGKSIVKETLPAFVIGVVFFYLAENLVDFFGDFGNDLQNSGNAKTLVGTVWSTVTAVVQILCIAGLILVGLKYMWSPSDKKADIKSQAVMIVLGLMLAISAVPILNFIIKSMDIFI